MWRGGGITPLSGNRLGEHGVLCLHVVLVMRVSCSLFVSYFTKARISRSCNALKFYCQALKLNYSSNYYY